MSEVFIPTGERERCHLKHRPLIVIQASSQHKKEHT